MTSVLTAIETRLATAPHQYGEPLRKTRHGYWKLRVGDYRVVFKIIGDAVLVLAIINRRDVYEAVGKRVERNGLADVFMSSGRGGVRALSLTAECVFTLGVKTQFQTWWHAF